MKNVTVTLLVLIAWAVANVCTAQTPPRKFQQPQEQAAPAPTPQPEQPRQPAPAPAPQEEKPPPDAIFYREISWSPDNSRIAFSAMQNSNGTFT